MRILFVNTFVINKAIVGFGLDQTEAMNQMMSAQLTVRSRPNPTEYAYYCTLFLSSYFYYKNKFT